MIKNKVMECSTIPALRYIICQHLDTVGANTETAQAIIKRAHEIHDMNTDSKLVQKMAVDLIFDVECISESYDTVAPAEQIKGKAKLTRAYLKKSLQRNKHKEDKIKKIMNDTGLTRGEVVSQVFLHFGCYDAS